MQRILVVEDDPDIQYIVQAVLTEEGYEVVPTEDGATALELTHTQQPQVVLLDLQLPGVDGLEVLRRLKMSPATAHVPVIAMSGERLVLTAARRLADGILHKPFDLGELLALVSCLGTQPIRRPEPAHTFEAVAS